VGIEDVIANELEKGAVDLVAACFGDDVHVGTRTATVGGVVQAGLHLEFLDGVRVGDGNAANGKNCAGSLRFHVAGVLAVHLVAVVHDAAAIHENVDGILAQISGIGHRTRNSWRKVEDLRVIAAAEGQGGDGFVIDDTAVGGAVGLKNVGGGFDGDLLGGLAELQPNVHRGGCGDINADARKCLRPKTRSGNRKGVSARRQQGDDEVAVGIGLRGANQ